MQKINFQDLPSTSTPLNASTLNQMQDNIESAIEDVESVIPTIENSLDSDSTTNGASVHATKLLNTYSTNELKIGKWIDSRPIYRKVVNFGALPNATTKKITTGLLIDEVNIVNYYGVANGVADNNKFVLSLPDISPNGANQATRITINTENNYYMINVLTGIDRSNYNAYIIVEYIKTTDPIG